MWPPSTRAVGMMRWSHWSLRRTLLVVLVPGLLAVLGLDILVSWRNTLAGASAAFDRSLLGAVKAMDANISTASGGLSVELPYRMGRADALARYRFHWQAPAAPKPSS